MKRGDFASWEPLTIRIKMVMILVQNIVFNHFEKTILYYYFNKNVIFSCGSDLTTTNVC